MKPLLILGSAFDADHLTTRHNCSNHDWTAADAAIFNVFLPPHGAVYDYFDLFPAIGTLDESGLKILH
jgi:hypothetical protein